VTIDEVGRTAVCSIVIHTEVNYTRSEEKGRLHRPRSRNTPTKYY